jgi:hypothetical protein
METTRLDTAQASGWDSSYVAWRCKAKDSGAIRPDRLTAESTCVNVGLQTRFIEDRRNCVIVSSLTPKDD